MSRVFTEAEWGEVWAEGIEQGKITAQGDEIESVSLENFSIGQTQLGSGQTRIVQLRPGLLLQVDDFVYHESFGEDHFIDESIGVVLHFWMIGDGRVQTFGVKDDYYEQAGENYLFFVPGTREIETRSVGRMLSICIHVVPHLLRTIAAGRSDFFPAQLESFLNGDTAPRFHQCAGKNTQQMQTALHQLLNCPYQGVTRQIYLESKVLELVALQFAQLVEYPVDEPRSISLKPDDRDRIYQAKEILLRNFVKPPSVRDLAQQVGLNEFKLRQGFYQMFGNTVFGCLQDHQMQEARWLLLEQNLTVEGVAAMVGYASRTAFHAAFRKKFGISPKEYQMKNKNTRS
ncbi:helix-turn-helix transcriptional regulator [Tolypothrix sp. VBCCA 56010]|uniref:helix-turn-helix transcriptional regulator n=1 Tax=Tolypothrix sp. VBCCA 56010 TaxID=3137731 RepID=UPI003D7CD69B